VGVLLAVQVGITRLVRVGVGAAVPVWPAMKVPVAPRAVVTVGAPVEVGAAAVDVIPSPAWIASCACSPVTGMIWSSVQNWPVNAQAESRSSCESASGSEGGPTVSFPLPPPNSTVTSCPAPKYRSSPPATMRPEPSKRLTVIFSYLVAVSSASPNRVRSDSLTVKRTPSPSGTVIMIPSLGIFSHTIWPSSLVK
jgi:hypothetical protein